MAKEYAKPFYNSKAWKKTRKSFIAYRISVDGGVCQKCKAEPGCIVDHVEEITPDNITNPSITLSYDNFQYLCIACHNIKTFGIVEENNYYFDKNGLIQEAPPIKKDYNF